jgi:initiation factor 1A
MVKNTHGGSGHKKFARKHTVPSKSTNKLRVVSEEGEIYAIVTALCGNNMFTCYCIDGVNRLGRIRGKFTGGRGKRDNMLYVGSWILVGLREWDIKDTSSASATATASTTASSKKKLQECDLLAVYSDSDKHMLIDTETEDWGSLIENDKTRNNEMNSEYNDIDNNIHFATNKDIERNQLIEKMNSETEKKMSLNITSTQNDDIDYNDEIDINDI